MSPGYIYVVIDIRLALVVLCERCIAAWHNMESYHRKVYFLNELFTDVSCCTIHLAAVHHQLPPLWDLDSRLHSLNTFG